MMTFNFLTVLEWNSNGLKNKTLELTHYLQSPNHRNTLESKINIKNYDTHRKTDIHKGEE